MAPTEYPGVELVPNEYDPHLLQAVLERMARRLSDRAVDGEPHAPTHQNGGDDEVGVSTPTANGLVKALGTALIDAGWLPPMVGDSGEGGVKGAVPAPAAGDAASGLFLKADGSWTAPPGAGGGEVNDGINLGAGQPIFTTKSGLNLQFKTVTVSGGLVLTPSGTELDVGAALDTDDIANASNVIGTTCSDALDELETMSLWM